MPQASPTVSVVIPNWNGQDLLPRCLSSLYSQTFTDFETIIVDNGSVDQSCALIERDFPRTRIIRLPENTGFANACNVGIAASGATYIVLLNNDTQARPAWLEHLVGSIEQAPPDVACVTSKMLKMDNPELIDDAGDFLTWRGGAFKRGNNQPANNFDGDEEVMFPCAGAALFRRSVLVELEAFDDRFFAYMEDVDLGLRMRLSGYRCLYAADAEILHVGHGSGIETSLYVFLTTRNRGYLFLKNIPARLLIKRIGSLLYGWLFFLVVHRGRWMYWRGSLAVLKNLPCLMEKRREQGKRTKLSLLEIDQLLSQPWPEITLGQLIRKEWRGGVPGEQKGKCVAGNKYFRARRLEGLPPRLRVEGRHPLFRR